MTNIIPRSHPRTTYETSIQYALLNTEQFEPTHTFDYSPEGFCYETSRELEPETEVCIVMNNYTPEGKGPEAYRSYVACIRWIHLFSNNGSKRYAAGAQILARSHDVLATDAQLPLMTCDLCGCMAPRHRVHTSETYICLCRQCMKHFSGIPSEKIRQCVERFLVGNVV